MHSWIRKSSYRQVVCLTGIPISLACCRHRTLFCLANGHLNESGSGISPLICVASKLPEKARRNEPSPAQLHAFCSQDYDTREIYAHIIWDVVQREKEREREMRNGALRDREGERRWGHSWMRGSSYSIRTDATTWSLTRNESSLKFKGRQCAYVCDMLILSRQIQRSRAM